MTGQARQTDLVPDEAEAVAEDVAGVLAAVGLKDFRYRSFGAPPIRPSAPAPAAAAAPAVPADDAPVVPAADDALRVPFGSLASRIAARAQPAPPAPRLQLRWERAAAEPPAAAAPAAGTDDMFRRL